MDILGNTNDADTLVNNDNLIFVDKKLDYKFYSAEMAHSTHMNLWKGWSCSTGIRNLYIDFDGNVFRGVCQQDGWIGNIFSATGLANGKNITDHKWVTCEKQSCFCGADMGVAKAKTPEYAKMRFYDSGTIKEPIKIHNPIDTIEPVAVCAKATNLFKLITWDLGRRCNFNCWYCSENSHNNYEVHKNYDMLFNAYTRLSNTWIRGERTKFNITGGEPTVYKDYLPFVKTLKEDGHIVMTTTNGSNSAKYYSELAEYSDICFSIHLEYVKQFGIDKFINSIQAAVDTRTRGTEQNLESQFNWISVRIMMDPGNQELAETFHTLCKEKFPGIVVAVDAVHQMDVNMGELFQYNEKEIIWLTTANN